MAPSQALSVAAIHRCRKVSPRNRRVVLLLRLNCVEHLCEARSITLAPPPFPSLDVVRMEMEVKQDGRPLHQGAKKNVRTEKVALPNQLADRKHNAERLCDTAGIGLRCTVHGKLSSLASAVPALARSKCTGKLVALPGIEPTDIDSTPRSVSPRSANRA
jgi:hypothetical protein